MKNHKAKKKNHTANNQKINRAKNNQPQKLGLSSKSIPCVGAFFF
jgi:hypothetical protein